LAYGVEGWLVAHKLMVLLIMTAVLGALITAERSLSLAELRFLWSWKFATRELNLAPHEATLSYKRLLKILQKTGYRKPPSQTPLEFALSFAGSGLSPGVLEFTQLYNALRFGQLPVPLKRLRALVEEIAKSARREARESSNRTGRSVAHSA
jgi:hypothetical protein